MSRPQTDDLATRVSALTDKTSRLRTEVAGLREQLATTRGRVGWVALLAVIALGLAVATWFNAHANAATDARVDAVCPVLALVVGGYDPASRAAGPDRDAYEANAEVMRRAYDGARCAVVAPLVPRRVTP